MPCYGHREHFNYADHERIERERLEEEEQHHLRMRSFYRELFGRSPKRVRTNDWIARRMCELLTDYEHCNNQTIRSCSLELQIWWRDHKIADAKDKRN